MAGHVFTLGATSVVWTVTDGSGNTTTCGLTVTVIDNIPPTISCVANQNRNTGAGTCTYTTVANEFDPTATADNCSVASVTNNVNGTNTLAGHVFTLGATSVVWAVTDGSGNTTTCGLTVTVIDNIPPTISCVANQNRNTGAGTCTYTTVGNEFDPTATADNCSVASVINNVNGTNTLAGHVFTLGATSVVWTVTDGSGNTTTCGLTVTVIDNIPPTISCVANQNRNTSAGTCHYTTVGNEFDPTATADNCSVASVTNNVNGTNTLAGHVFTLGATSVVWTVTDGSGNTTTCGLTVTVIDNIPPTISCVANQNRNTTAGTCHYTTVANEFDPTATADNCSVASVTNNVNGTNTLAGHVFTLGATSVVWTITDGSGNTTTCGLTVTVIDNIPPTISCVANQNRNTGAGTCTYTTVANEFDPTATADNCSVASVTNNVNGTNTLAGHVFTLGATSVVWTVTDGSGNTTTCGLTVTVIDNIPPTISCVANQNRNTGAGTCTYTTVGNEFDPTATADNCSVASVTNNVNGTNTLAGHVFTLGATSVVWTVTDGSGNTTTCGLTVTVIDNIPPTISCVANQNRNTGAGTCTYTTVGNEFDPTATADNCSVASVTNNVNGTNTLAGHVFTLGATSVVWTVTDGSGNTTTCGLTVTVIDNIPPTISCVANQNRNTGAGTCSYTTVGNEFDPTATADNCSVASVTNNVNGTNTLAGHVFTLGATSVVWTVTDGSGNTTTCGLTVTVIDNIPPTISCVANQNRNTTAGTCHYTTVANEFDPTATADNCSVASVTNNVNGTNTLAGHVFTLGATSVVWTVTDGSGNTTTCGLTVTVIDNIPPTISCVANQNRNTTAGTCHYTAVGNEFDPTATADNCSVASVTNNVNGTNTLAGQVFTLGAAVLWTVTDGSGNTTTCGLTVTVIDNIPPTISCVANQNRNTGAGTCTYTTVGNEFDLQQQLITAR